MGPHHEWDAAVVFEQYDVRVTGAEQRRGCIAAGISPVLDLAWCVRISARWLGEIDAALWTGFQSLDNCIEV